MPSITSKISKKLNGLKYEQPHQNGQTTSAARDNKSLNQWEDNSYVNRWEDDSEFQEVPSPTRASYTSSKARNSTSTSGTARS